jgi:hypothetical protein
LLLGLLSRELKARAEMVTTLADESLEALKKKHGLSLGEYKRILRERKAPSGIMGENQTKEKNSCANGEHCQKIVSEAALGGLLAQGWRVVCPLPSGKIVIRND